MKHIYYIGVQIMTLSHSMKQILKNILKFK